MFFDDFLQREFLDNKVEAWTAAVLVLLISYILLQLIKYFAANRLTKLAQRTATDVDDFVAELIASTNSFVLFILSVFLGSLRLEFSLVLTQVIRMIAVFALLIQIGLWIMAIIDFWIQRDRNKREAPGVQSTTLAIVSIMFKIAVWVLVLLVALDNIPGVRITTLVASLGIGGIAVGLALQSILSDIFASVSIALDKPFVIGDAIRVDDLVGTVEHIGLQSVRVRSLSGEIIVFSTSDLLDSRIHNYRHMERRLVVLKLGISYNTPRQKVARIPGMLQEIISQFEQVTFERSHFTGFGDSSLNFETAYYIDVPDFAVYMDKRQAVGFAVLERFEAEGIDMPYPTQVIMIEKMPQPEEQEA